ncbi:MAG TPA: 2Fe-2S iron-sulfur cluster-binding protein, partial [Thermoanaerobaculia bacterium]
DALQCGFCTSGMVMSCQRLLERNPKPSRPEIREAIAGNLCRCGTYNHVFDAVEHAAGIRNTGDARSRADSPILVSGETPSFSRLTNDSRVDAATLEAMEEEA